MMKHMKYGLPLILALTLVGCSDAQAKLKDANTAVMKIGNEPITKGQVYDILRSTNGYYVAMSDVTQRVSDIEVPVTDEMLEEARNELEDMKSYYGELFTSYLESNGLSDEDYIQQSIIPSLQSEQLPLAYIEENLDELIESAQPVKATILDFENEENASMALSILREGSSSVEEVASEYSLYSTGRPTIITLDNTAYDATITSVIRSASVDDGWTMLPSSTSIYYVLRVEENDPENMKEELKTYFASSENATQDALVSYLKKYNFHIYDIDLYNQIKENDSQYIVQD